tara:strand:+ start:856 stop:1755 length:900 start_codon:yes stop_codon:yes gene_type:complete
MNKLLVTGGCGFIGSTIVDELVKDGYEVVVIDDLSSETNEQFYFNNKATYFEEDIADYDRTKHLYKDVSVVYHLAAEARIQAAIDKPLLAAKKNTLGTCCVLQCAYEAGVKRVVYSSTSAAYGLKNSTPQREDMIEDCLNPYSVSKVAGEKFCKMYTDLFDLETVIFRYFNVYGERQPERGQYAPVISIFLRQNKNKESLTIVGDGSSTRDFVHVKDIARGNILAGNLDNKKPIGHVINLGTGKGYSVRVIANMISKNQTQLPPRKGEAKDSIANNTKAKKLLNWSPISNVEDWIKHNS